MAGASSRPWSGQTPWNWLTIFAPSGIGGQVSPTAKPSVSAEAGTDPDLPTPEARPSWDGMPTGDAIINYLPTNGGMPSPGPSRQPTWRTMPPRKRGHSDGAVTTGKPGVLAVTAAKLRRCGRNGEDQGCQIKIKDHRHCGEVCSGTPLENGEASRMPTSPAKPAADVPSTVLRGLCLKPGSIANPGSTGNQSTFWSGFRPACFFVMAVRTACPGSGVLPWVGCVLQFGSVMRTTTTSPPTETAGILRWKHQNVLLGRSFGSVLRRGRFHSSTGRSHVRDHGVYVSRDRAEIHLPPRTRERMATMEDRTR